MVFFLLVSDPNKQKTNNVPRDLPWKVFIDSVRFVLIKKINSVYLFLTDFTSTFIQTDANVSNHITQRNYEYILSQWFDLRNSSVNFSFKVRLQTNWHKKEWCVKDLWFSRQPIQRINISRKDNKKICLYNMSLSFHLSCTLLIGIVLD